MYNKVFFLWNKQWKNRSRSSLPDNPLISSTTSGSTLPMTIPHGGNLIRFSNGGHSLETERLEISRNGFVCFDFKKPLTANWRKHQKIGPGL
jgi:hypothetical protein